MALDGFTAFEHALPVRLLQGRRGPRREVGDLLHADAARRLRRPVGRAVLLADRQPARRPEAQPLRAPRRPRPAWPAAPVDLARRSTTSRPSRAAPPPCCAPAATSRSAPTASSRASASTGSSGRWPAKAAAADGLRDDADGGAAGVDDRRRPTSSASLRTSGRSRPASSPTSWSSTPIRSRTSTTPTKIRWVVKNGEVWEAETMKKIWPREEPPPKFFWQSGQ